MSYCTNCGETLNVEDRFCRNCGTKLNPAILKKKSSEESISEIDISNQESTNYIPKSKKLIATELQNTVNDEAYKEASKEISKNRMKAWLGIFFFGFCGIIGLVDRNWILLLGGFGFVVAGIWILNKSSSLYKDKMMRSYQVGKGFSFYRKSAEQKNKVYNYGQIGIVLTLLLMFITGNMGGSVGYVIGKGIAGVIFLQIFKNKIKMHTIIDEPTLFELEERRIIEPQEIVKSLYKDFESWNNVKQRSKILLLTTDKLIMIIINSIDEYKKMECRLRSIERVDIIGHGKNGEGLILSIGTNDNNLYRIKLDGESFQDSPEEFLSTFFQALDEALIQAGKIKDVKLPSLTSKTENTDFMNKNREESTEKRQLDFGQIEDSNQNVNIDNISTRHIDL